MNHSKASFYFLIAVGLSLMARSPMVLSQANESSPVLTNADIITMAKAGQPQGNQTPRAPVAESALFASLVAVAEGQAPRKPPAERARSVVAALSPQQIFKRAAPSVMVVKSLDAKGAVITLGSGVVIAPGRIVTNRHVIEDGISFRLEHGGKTWPAQLVRVDPDHDLAELSVPGLAAPAVHVRPSSTLNVGEKVYAIGSPEGLELTISDGLISGLRDFDKDRVIQTSAAICGFRAMVMAIPN
ncbi:MAG: S1C family serine protease [Terriglobia bacterium]